MSAYGWLVRRTGLPIELGPVSNGEYAPLPPTDLVKEAAKRALSDIEDNRRRTGMSRRRFIAACGNATVLAALAACSREQAAVSTETSPSTTGAATTQAATSTAPGGTFEVPEPATTEPEAAAEVLGGNEVIVDVQTHLLEFDEDSPRSGFWGSGFPQASCDLDDPRDCFSIEQWLALVLGGSDTTIAVLSAVPIADDPSPLSIDVMERGRVAADALGCMDNVLIQGQVFPTIGRLDAALDAMTETAAAHDLAAWKVYTHTAGNPWFLDDHDPSLPAVGQAFLDRVRETAVPVVAVHKGFGNRFASPADVGPAAVANPDLSFLVYHSGFQPGVFEGPYDPSGGGIDRLIASVELVGLGAGGNVYAELGSTWFNLMRDPTQAAHALGKLLVAFGADNILWGTDSIWYGSPQGQIEAFRAFQISEELQEQFGYPALTDAVKAKILGGNAAALHGIDPATVNCTPRDPEGVYSGALGPATAAETRAVFAADHPWA